MLNIYQYLIRKNEKRMIEILVPHQSTLTKEELTELLDKT
jgi:hypothetical protein